MKAKMLKMAGVKTEKEFYKRYPTKESFVAKYGAEMRKDPAQWGAILQAVPAIMSAIGSMKKSDDGGQDQTTTDTTTLAPVEEKSTLQKFGEQAPGIIGTGFKIADAFKAQKEQLNQAKQINQVTEAALMAQRSDRSKEEEALNRQQFQVNPWDNVINPDHRLPSLGVGTNVLAKYGTTMKAETGKQFKDTGFGKFLQSDQFGNFANSAVNSWTKNSAGSQVGGAAADLVGKIPGLGPVAKKVAGPVLQAAGHLAFSLGAENRTGKQLDQATQNINTMSGMNFGNLMQNKNKAFVKDGGKFYNQGGTLGGDLQTLDGGTTETLSFNPYSPGNGETAILKGNYHTEGGIETAYGGKRIEAEHDEPVIQNKDESISIMGRLNLPKGYKDMAEDATGEKLSGKKFNTFIKSVGEAEERQNKLIDDNVDKASNYTPLNSLDRISLQTLDLNINKVAKPKLKLLQDVKDQASSLQSAINETAEEMNLDAESLSLGKLKAKRGRKIGYYQPGGDVKKEEETKKDPVFKNIEEARAEGYDWVDVDGEKVLRKTIKEGTDPEEVTTLVPDEIIDPIDDPQVDNSYTVKGGESEVTPEHILNNPNLYKTFHKRMEGAPDDVRKAAAEALYKKGTMPSQYVKPMDSEDVEQTFTEEKFTIDGTDPEYAYASLSDTKKKDPEKKERFPWENYLNMIPGLFDDSDAEQFNNRQLIPEMFALSNNQLEPVDAQKFTPRLDLPYDISYQEALNRNTASNRAAMRMAAHNPGMLANLQAQKYMGDQNVLAEQFRANQAKKDAVYSGNRKILNDADKINLAIMDKQYERQAKAKSATKATTQAALNSISDKVAKHALENKKLRVWENMYDYRFDPNYRTRYTGDPVAWENMWNASMNQQTQIDPKKWEAIRDESGEVIDYRKRKKGDKPSMATPNYFGKNGSLVKKIKKFK